MTPFQIFNLPIRFQIDLKQLEKHYFDVQKRIHPDRFASASEGEKRIAQQWTTMINDAYQKLLDPVKRAELICALKGHPVDAERSGGIDEAFLLDQLERREAIAEANEAQDEAALERLRETIETEKNERLHRVEILLDEQSDAVLAAEEIKKIMFLNRQLQDFE